MNFCHVHHVPMQFTMYPLGWTCYLCAPVFDVVTTNTSQPFQHPYRGDTNA